MLKKSTFYTGTALAENMSKNGLQMEPIGGTSLDEICRASWHPSMDRDDMEGVDFQDILLSSDGNDGESAVTHEETMEHYVKLAAKTVSENIQLARTVVNPLVKDVAEKAQQYINEAELTAVNFLSVVPRFVPAAWRNQVLDGLVEKYAETPAEDVALKKIYPAMTPEEIREAAKSGTTRLDNDLNAMFEDMGDERLVGLYKLCFQAVSAGEMDPLPEMRLSDFTRLGRIDYDALIFIFMVARRFYQDAPEGVKVSLEDHREYCATLMSQSGRAIVRAMETYERNLRTRNLNIRWPVDLGTDSPAYNTIEVNGDVYNQWVKEGGTPETLFGAYLAGKPSGFQELLERREELERVWQKQVNIRSRSLDAKRITVTVTAIRRAMTTCINDLDEEEIPVERGVLHERLVEQLNGVELRHVEKFYALVRRVVCNVIYAHMPDALTILESIDELGAKNPEMEVREVALLATIDLVADWIACQMSVTRAPTI